MKKLFFLFTLIFSIAKGDYLATNGEIALFYDETKNKIEYIRGDIYKELNISQMELYFLKGDRIIPVKNNIISVQGIGSNIIKMEYLIDEHMVNTYIFSSLKNKKNLYFYTDTSELSWDTPFQIIYMLSPMENTNYLTYKDDYFYYGDRIKMNSLDNKGNLYMATPENFYNLKLILGENNRKKNSRERLYYFSTIKNKDIGDRFLINFATNKYLQNGSTRDLLKENLEYWNRFNKKNNFYRKEIKTQLEFLEILTKNYKIPKHIDYDKSIESFKDRLNLAYVDGIFLDGNIGKILLEELYFKRKNNFEEIKYYDFLFKMLSIKEITMGEKFYRENITPQINKHLRQLVMRKIKIDNREDYDNYYDLLKFIEIYKNQIKDEVLLKRVTEFKIEIIEKLKENMSLIIPKSELYGKIEYLDIYNDGEKKEILEKIYKNYYNSRVGVLNDADNREIIDIKLNLEYVLRLYENNMKNLGDIIFSRLDNLIKKNRGYIIPKMKINGQNSVGLYSNPLYLYFKIVQYRGIEWI